MNRAPDRQAPYVGASAFTTKAGIHASAIVRDPKTYEHVPPDAIGNRRQVLVSEQAGKANLVSELTRMGLTVEKSDPRLDTLLRLVKEREAAGYAYESAAASFELLARRTFGTVPQFFDVRQFDVNVENRVNAKGNRVTLDWLRREAKKASEGEPSYAEFNISKKPLAIRRTRSISGHVAGEKGPSSEDVISAAIGT